MLKRPSLSGFDRAQGPLGLSLRLVLPFAGLLLRVQDAIVSYRETLRPPCLGKKVWRD